MINFDNVEDFQVEKAWAGAVQLLVKVGLRIENPAILKKIKSSLEIKNGSALFTTELIDSFANEIKTKGRKSTPTPKQEKITIHNTPLAFQVIDPVSGKCNGFDTPTVLKYSRLIFQLAREGIMTHGNLAGSPSDIAPQIRMLYRYYLECRYNPAPSVESLGESVAEMMLVFEVSKLMGFELVIGTQLISPMKFVGSAQDIAVALGDYKPRIVVDPMPIMGVTAPLDWHGGWAQSIAENLGSYILFRLCGLENVDPPWFRLFVPNMMTGSTYFSSPFHLYAMLTRRKVRTFFELQSNGSEMMLVTANRPNQHALTEKVVGCMIARMYGFNSVGGAGNLGMDQIFSCQQLIIDLEIKNFVNSIGASFGEGLQETDRIVAEVKEGIEQGSFLGVDSTLDHLYDYSWRPILFSLSAYGRSDWQSVLSKANTIAEEKIAQNAKYEYELTGDKRKELDKILQRAKQLVADGEM